MLTNAETIKYELDVVDKMIDLVQRRIRSNENLLGAISSSYEYETFMGYAIDEAKIDEAKKDAQMLGNLLKYRSGLMDYASGISSSQPSLEVPDGFKF